ncbi:MAG: HU family DNA-binding protein [Paramuribaculum sp.]|nr:HU family DNA-binding protein [Paramuribaculum sp.]
MNTKIPLRKFAETLSDKSDISVAEAENFIKLVFGIASEELRTGSTVRIKGLGAFSLSRGEADPVNFEPDKNFAAAVNSPFAIFAPVELADGVTDEILSDIDRSNENNSAAQEVPEYEFETASTDVASISVDETETEAAQTLSEADIPEESVTEETSSAEVSDAEEVIAEENTAETCLVEKPTLEEPVSEPESEDCTEAAAEFEEPTEQAETAQSVTTDWEYEEEEYVQQPERNESRFGAGFVAGLIVGIAIGALALCAYVMYYVNSTPENQSIDTELIETAPEPLA